MIMADVNALYQGEFLRASNLGGVTHTVVIVEAPAEMVGQGDKAQQKIVLHLAKPNGKALKQKLPLNKTNALLLASIFGPRTENWIGRQILLKPEKVLMQGSYVDAIRVYAAPESLGKPPVPVAAVAAGAAVPAAVSSIGRDLLDDEAGEFA